MLKEILIFFKKVITALTSFFRWILHHLFMRLWLGFAALLGISTASTCPCCGQAAAACPTGFSLIAGLAGLLALLGVLQKKVRGLLRKIFPFLTETGSHYVFWGLIIAALIACSAFGLRLIGQPLVQGEWSPAYPRVITQPSTPARSIPVIDPPSAAIKAQGQPVTRPPGEQKSFVKAPAQPIPRKKLVTNANPESKLPQIISPLSSIPAVAPKKSPGNDEPQAQMRAIIDPDGSVEIQKPLEGLIRYETWNFMELNDDIYERINAYRGKKVQVEGYVYRRSDFEPGYFVAARLYMWCCAMCAAPVGPLCKWAQADKLNDGDWIRVEGVIEPMFFHDTFEDASGDIPLIKVEKVERIEKLKNPYVYLRNTPPISGQCKIRSVKSSQTGNAF